jgi:5-methylcytosine-specific restriction endonuclease McrA
MSPRAVAADHSSGAIVALQNLPCYTGIMKIRSLSQLSDAALTDEVSRLAVAEKQATAHLIAALAEFDARRLYLGQGFSSLFTYCTQVLHLSEHAAYNRIESARAAHEFPLILEMLHAGDLTVTSVRLLAPHLTEPNHREVLREARHKTKRDVEEIAARLRPKPDAPAIVRKLPAPSVKHDHAAFDLCATVTSDANTVPGFDNASQPSKCPCVLTPLAPERYKLQVTLTRDTYEKLHRVQDLLRHSTPAGDLAVILDRALTLLLADLERQKIASVARPRQSRRVTGSSRRIPAGLKRAVWKRDGGQCAFSGARGRCTETGFLEFHHIRPFAAGGDAAESNIQLRCRAHNQYEADLFFGGAEPCIARERPEAWSPNSFRNDLSVVGTASST